MVRFVLTFSSSAAQAPSKKTLNAFTSVDGDPLLVANVAEASVSGIVAAKLLCALNTVLPPT